MGVRGTQAGLTLIEIIVVLAIVGFLMLAVGTGLLRSTRSVLRKDTTRFAATVRSGFDRALASGAHHRVIIDLDEKTFFLERCEGKVIVRRAVSQAEMEEAEAEKAAAAQKLAERTAESQVAQVLGEAGRSLGGGAGAAQVPCEPVKGEMGKPFRLDTGKELRFGEVRVEHLEDPVTTGKVHIHFFPMGYSERAVVELTTPTPSSDDDVYSVLLHPLSGRVEVKSGQQRDREDFTRRDDSGAEIVR